MSIRTLYLSLVAGLALLLNSATYATDKPVDTKDSKPKQHAIILIVHTVDNYDAWRKIYDQHAPDHAKMGIKDLSLYQTIGKPNEVTILQETDDLEKAKEFLTGPDSGKMYKGSGVIGTPQVIFIEKAK